jgi:hypothetical protein
MSRHDDAHHSREARVHRAIASACADDARADDARALLVAASVDDADALAILDRNPRFWLYRELVRNNMRGVVRDLAPRAAALFEARAPGVLDESIDAFLRAEGVRSHYFRDVPYEWLAWAAPRLREDARAPRIALDLAAWELFWFRVKIAERALRPETLHDVAPDRALVFESPALLARFEHRIHTFEDGDADPSPAPTHLLGYRDKDGEPKLLELTPLAAAVVKELQSGTPLARAIPAAWAAENVAVMEGVLADVAKLLADLAENEIILGARP